MGGFTINGKSPFANFYDSINFYVKDRRNGIAQGKPQLANTVLSGTWYHKKRPSLPKEPDVDYSYDPNTYDPFYAEYNPDFDMLIQPESRPEEITAYMMQLVTLGVAGLRPYQFGDGGKE